MSAPAGLADGLLAGRYRLTSRLAAGAVGEVWRARDLLLHRDVAVKTLRPELADDAEARERFRVEGRAAGRVAHPGIASVYDVGEDDGRAWLVLQLVEGESLRSLLRREGRLSPERTLDVVVQTAAALQAAHDSGVVHRDVKPANLLVRPDGAVKVTDFGIASVVGSARLTRTGQLVGTAAYLSPEQADGGVATAASDLYALGVVAYECLSGAVPFDFDNPVAVLLAHSRSAPPPLPAEVPAPLRRLVVDLLAKDPRERPASAGEVVRRAESVRAALSGSGSSSAGSSLERDTAPHATAVLASVAATAPAPARPARPSRAAESAGLWGRRGQRRAVSLTALLLGLLAVALGVRGASDGPDVPAPALSPAPTSSPAVTPPPSATATGPADSAAPVAPAPVAPDAPVQEQPQQVEEQQVEPQAPVQQRQEAPPAAPPDGGAQDASDSPAGTPDKAAEKAAEDAPKTQQERGNGNSRSGGNGKGNGQGSSEDSSKGKGGER